jgi:hypothetical protein
MLSNAFVEATSIAVADASPIMNVMSRGRQFASVFAVGSAVVCLYSMRQADPDLWGYLTYGRLFVESGGLTSHDPFAYTSSGFQWTTFEYGAQVLLWVAYHLAGPSGLIALKCLVGGVALCCLSIAIRATTHKPSVWVPIFLLCTSAICRFFLFRPQLFTFAFFALFVAVLFQFLLRRRAPLWALPLVMLAWANVHGGFVAGLGALVLVILLRASENLAAFGWRPSRLAEGTRRLWVALAACTAATFINPLGPKLWVYVVTELSHGTNRQYVVEWAPASLHRDAWSTIALTLITITLAVVGWAAQKHHTGSSPGPLPMYWVASCVPLIAMSYLSIRHVPLAAIWTGPVIAWLASLLPDSLPQSAAFRRTWFVLRATAVLQVCVILAIVYGEPRPSIRVDGSTLGATHPCGAVGFLRSHRAGGNLYNPLWWGAYTTWKLYPSVRVSMDGRNVSLFSDEMVLENLRFYLDEASHVDIDAPSRYPTDFLLVPTDAPVLRRVLSDSRWRRVYADADAVLFERAGVSRTLADPSAPDRVPVTAQKPACEAFLD